MKKDSLLKGTVILAAAAFIARFLGLIQRIPLQRLLGDAGMATYGIAYNVYSVLLIVATAGVPSALSKLISERLALGKKEEANRIFRAAVIFSIAAGVIMTIALMLAAPHYAEHISRDPDADLAIRALAPALLIFPFIAIMRGYFQGRQLMTPGGLSQIAEQILRVFTAVGLAYLLLVLGFRQDWVIAGASFGGVMGGVAALAVLLYFWKKLWGTDAPQHEHRGQSVPEGRLSYRQIYGQIFSLSIPISIISMTVPMIYMIDSSTVIAFIEPLTGYAEAKEQLGILTGRAQSLAGIPPILAIALSTSVVPVVSSAFAKGDLAEVSFQSGKALRIALLSGLPLVLILSVAARPLNGLLFSDTEGTLVIAAMTVSSMFQILMMSSGGILMGLGKIKAPMAFVGIGLAIKLAGGYLLAPWLGIYGIIAATALCFAVIMLLNLLELRKTVSFVVLGRKWWGLLALIGLCVLLGWGTEMLVQNVFQTLWAPLAFFLQAVCVSLVVLGAYMAFLFWFRIVTKEELGMLPAPVRRLLGRFKGFG